jgi:inosose dehydratase
LPFFVLHFAFFVNVELQVIRLANAPCSWGVLEFDRASATVPFDRMLDELAEAGYAGTELGDWGYMPTDAATLSHELGRRGLTLVGAFVPVAFAEPREHARGVETAVLVARLLEQTGGAGAVVVLSDDNGRVPLRAKHAGRIRPEQGLSAGQWNVFAGGAERVAERVRCDTGLRTVFHPHCGGYVETPAEIDELMRRTDPALLGLCLDTGHIVFGGGDPLDVLGRYAPRVWHVHFKDCDRTVADQARREGLAYEDAVRRRLFCELGAGQVDFRRVVEALERSGFDGWAVVEQDVFPGRGTPAESARASRAFLRGLGL